MLSERIWSESSEKSILEVVKNVKSSIDLVKVLCEVKPYYI